MLSHCYITDMRQESVPNENEGCLHWLCFKTWYPFSSLRSILLLSLIFGVVFIGVSISLFAIYSHNYSYKSIYSENGRCQGSGNGTNCQITLTFDHDLQPPVLFLYSLDNVYINHRKYINSVSMTQLEGKAIDKSKAETMCTPFVLNKDFPVTKSFTGQPLDSQLIAYPCGFKSFLTFNDSYSLYNSNGDKIDIDQRNLDKEYTKIFKSRPGSENEQWMDVENEHFQQWIKNQAMISKHKLWGRINQKLPKGKYNMVVKNNYKIGEMRISKGIELVVPSRAGGPIYFFPISFAIMGLMCIGYAIFLRLEMGDYDQMHKKD